MISFYSFYPSAINSLMGGEGWGRARDCAKIGQLNTRPMPLIFRRWSDHRRKEQFPRPRNTRKTIGKRGKEEQTEKRGRIAQCNNNIRGRRTRMDMDGSRIKLQRKRRKKIKRGRTADGWMRKEQEHGGGEDGGQIWPNGANTSGQAQSWGVHICG